VRRAERLRRGSRGATGAFAGAFPFEYPEHLREAVEGVPSCPGVYVFHGERADLPLYIGKSVNIRARLLSHFRNPDEAAMLRQARRISHIRTAGEIGALLLEAQMIKTEQPLFNQKLRRVRRLCSLRVRGGEPEVVCSTDFDFAAEPDLYGLFSSRRAALEALRVLADENRLCHGALGLEKLSNGRPCFRAMIRRCSGVCRGDESPREHRQRLIGALEALRVACWPYPGAIGLVERDGDFRQVHVVRNWCYLGSTGSEAQARSLGAVTPGFDADGYRILCAPVLTRTVDIVPL